MKIQEKFPKLRNLFGSYFTPYWEDDYEWNGNEPSFREIIRFYKTNNPKESVAQATKELGILLSEYKSESELEDIMCDGFVNSYYPYGDDSTYLEWLNEILKILEEPIEKTKKEFIPKFVG
jgi:hypothetical protein